MQYRLYFDQGRLDDVNEYFPYGQYMPYSTTEELCIERDCCIML